MIDFPEHHEPELLIRYGQLTAHARDRVLDQFYLTYATSASLSAYLQGKTLATLAAFVVVAAPVFLVSYIVAQLLKMDVANTAGFVYLCITIAQLAFFSTVFANRVKTRHKEYPMQTNEIGLSPSRIFVHARYIHGGCVKSTMLWKEISGVRTFTKVLDGFEITYIEIYDIHGKKITLQLDCIQTIEERQILRDCLRAFASQADTSEVVAVLSQVGKANDVPFTKLWSQALKDSRARVRTEVLPDGTQLQSGLYSIQHRIGSGGQGAVYLAEVRGLQVDVPQFQIESVGTTSCIAPDQIETIGTLECVAREPSESVGATPCVAPDAVVLKEYVLPDQDHAVEHKDAVEQFEREIHLLAKLNHPGIIKMLNAFVEDHRAYLVLEHCDGASLTHVVQQKGPLTCQYFADVAFQLCDILEYLHGLTPAVMHLDFSPDNILLSKDGHLTVIDFNVSAEENSLRSRTVMGKQRYMSPEQYRGRPTTRSDIYSLGATCYFLLTGKEPAPISVAKLSKALPDIDPSLHDLLAKATSLEEEDRFQSIKEFRDALKDWSRTTVLQSISKACTTSGESPVPSPGARAARRLQNPDSDTTSTTDTPNNTQPVKLPQR